MAKKNEVAIKEETALSSFEMLKNTDTLEFMAEELDGFDVNLEKIKIPSGGLTVFQFPSGDPDAPDNITEFDAVILYHHIMQIYYKDKFTGGNAPPDCVSYDGKIGQGDPGGDCQTCPYNKFGSAENNAKACKKRRSLYLLCEDEIFPRLLSLPTGSLKPFMQYIVRLGNSGMKRTNTVVTRFTLKAAQNTTGIKYSQVQCRVVRDLTEDEKEQILKLSEISIQ